MTYSWSLQAVRSTAESRPAGWLEEILSAGKIEGELLVMEAAVYRGLFAKYRGEVPGKISAPELVQNLTNSLAKSRALGLKFVDRETYQKRMGKSGCGGCKFWVIDPLLKISRCEVCGCTDLKPWFASEECPLPEPQKRWRKQG